MPTLPDHPSLAAVADIASTSDPVQRNCRITLGYWRLALAVRALLPGGVNWCGFGTWASKQAGQSIRQEDVEKLVARTLRARLEQRPLLAEVHQALEAKADFAYAPGDVGACLASGSFGTAAMVVAPCSMKTLAAVSHGLSRNLVERAADVMLKERRPLVIVPRETPMSLMQLRNMVLCAEAGAIMLPAMPAFYQQPRTIEDLAAFIAGKILNGLGFDQHLFTPWSPTRPAKGESLR